MTDTVAAAQIRSYVARVLRLREEIAALNADVSEVYKEAVGNGFDKKTLQATVKRAALAPEAVQEQDALLELYWRAYTGTDNALVRAGAPEAPATPHDIDGVVIEPAPSPTAVATIDTRDAVRTADVDAGKKYAETTIPVQSHIVPPNRELGVTEDIPAFLRRQKVAAE